MSDEFEIRERIQKAVLEEREACAILAEQHQWESKKYADWNRQIAAAIRDRS